jgi:tetratricopeptide (TPR) repeat protein/predicted Ser/Thr protein kinase
MPVLISCPRGHKWEDTCDDPKAWQDGQPCCPVCGVVLDESQASLLAGAVLLPPTKRLPTANDRVAEAPSPDVDVPAGGRAFSVSPSLTTEHRPAAEVKDVGTEIRGEEEQGPASIRPSLPGYEILTELGRGGMGVVYLARQTALDRFVAIKMVLGGGCAGEARRRRFRLEAQAVARLHHPNIVQIYDVDEQDEHPYFTIEFVDGGSLADRIAAGPLPPREAAGLIEVLARAIHCAHERGIVHRDLKPGNVLLARDGTPKITDFGLAKLVDGQDGHTRTGSVLGTPSYMAPEQALGQNRAIGPPADIYALGSILYETVTGRPPFVGATSVDVIVRLANDDPEPPSRVRPGVPRDLETICLKCLEKAPRKRYASALELAEDLHRFLAHESVLARPATYGERGVKWVRRHPARAVTILCLLLAALAVTGQAAYQSVTHARSERRKLENARSELGLIVLRAEEAVKSQAWEGAAQLVASADDRIESEPGLAALPRETAELLGIVRGRLNAHRTLQEFSQKRDDALFHATLCTGEGSGADLRAARDKAREALALGGVAVDGAERWSLGDSFTAAEKEQVREKCYELLLVLADAEAQPSPGWSEDEQRGRAVEALRILDRAPLLGLRTKAYHLRRARLLTSSGHPNEAKEEVARAERAPPESALDHYLLGDELYRQGLLEAAQAQFQLALRNQPDHFWAHYFLALTDLRLRRPDLARDNLTACLSQRPQIVWIYLMRGFACGQMGEYPAAEADFAEALRLLDAQPNDDARYVLYNNRAISRVGQTRLESAIDDLRRAIDLRPNHYQAYVSLAQTLHVQKRPLEAVAQLDEAIKAAEPLVRVAEVEPATLALLYRTRARFQRERDDDAAALADLDHAVAVAPAGSLILAQAQVERGHLLHRSGRWDDARIAYEAALQARPRHAPAHRLPGEVLFRLKRYADAIREFTSYLETESNKPPAAVYQARALARVRLGDPKTALDDFTLALNLEPDNATLLTQRGQAFLACQSDQHNLTLQDFDEALKRDPNNGPAYAGRARVRLELGQLSDALADGEKALAIGPRTTSVVYGTARLYARAAGKLDADGERKKRSDLETRGQYHGQALALLGQATRLLPENERAAFWRDTVLRDSAWAPIRQSIEFARLRRQYASGESPGQPASPGSSPGVLPPD